MAKAKQKTISLELNEGELDTLFIGLERASGCSDDEDFKYFMKLMAKIEKAQKKLIKEAA